MKIAVAILLNAALLSLLLPWLRRQWQQVQGWVRLAMAAGLGGRLLVGIATGLHLQRDAKWMSAGSYKLTAQIWADPLAALSSLWGNEMHFGNSHLVFYGMSNTFFFVKIIAFLNLASLDTNCLNAVYFSLFSFVGCWQLIQALARCFPRAPIAASIIAFGVWPSVVYWASGVTKESVVLGSGAWLLAIFIELFWERRSLRARLGQVVALLLLAVIHFKMRYFFAAPLLGSLFALACVQWLQQFGWARSRWAQVVIVLAVLGGGMWVASELSLAFRVNKFTNQVVRIYSRELAFSGGRPHIEYPELQPTLGSIVRHVPLAMVNAIARPWLGESWEPRYLLISLENAVLLVLLAASLLAAWNTKRIGLPFGLVLVLLIQCLVLATLLGLSAPNLGALHRYRSGLLPYLLLLLLQNDYAANLLRRLGFWNETGWPPKATSPLETAPAPRIVPL